jgi:hypothetical protein
MIIKDNITKHLDFWLLGVGIGTMPLPYRYSNLIFIPIILYWMASKKYEASLTAVKESTILKLFIVLFLITFLSIVTSKNFNMQFGRVEKYLPLITIPLFVSGYRVSAKQLNDILLFFFVGLCLLCTIYSLISTLIVYDLTVDYILSDATVFSYFSWILPNTLELKSNYYSLYIGLCLVILLDNIFNNSAYKKYRPVLWAVFSFLFIFMGLLSSRTAFIAVALLIVLYLFKFFLENRFKIVKLLVVAGILLSLLILSLQLPFMHSKVFNFLEAGTESDPRYIVFQCGWKIFKENFLFGAGVFDVEELALNCYRAFGDTHAVEEKYNLHNVFLQWGASTGIVGVVVYSILIVVLFIRALKADQMIPLGFIFLFFLASLTESLLTRNKGLIFFTTFSTVFFIRKPNEEDTPR